MLDIFLLGLALAATPGPDFFLMTKNTLSNGRKYGFITLLGNRVSLNVHILFAILGLSLILQQSAVIFTSIRLLGAFYLIYLGYNKLKAGWRKPANTMESVPVQGLTKLQAFRMGFLSNFLNPKVSLFFLSIFPQFASSHQISEAPLMLAVSFLAGNSLWYVSILLIISLKPIRKVVQTFQHYLDFIFGLVFIIYGGKIIWEEIHKYLSFENFYSGHKKIHTT